MTNVWHPHVAGRNQSWQSVDDDLRAFILEVAEEMKERLRPNGFTGAYLHGSLAMSCFYRPKSDLDILFVVDQSMIDSERRSAALGLCDLSDRRPITGDLEVSVLLREDAKSFRHPSAFELHYSEEHKSAIRAGTIDLKGEKKDVDLACHLTVLRQRGHCLLGEPVDTVFGAVPIDSFRDSVLDDLDWILANENIIESPFYGILNCCRVLAMKKLGFDKVWSKEEGGEWGIANLPEAKVKVVEQALSCYRSSQTVSAEERQTDGHGWDREALLDFRDFVREMI